MSKRACAGGVALWSVLQLAACGGERAAGGGAGASGAALDADGGVPHASSAAGSNARAADGGAVGAGGAGAASGTGATAVAGSSGASGTGSGGAAGSQSHLADEHRGDIGIADDPNVVWAEDFEEGSLDALLSRYEDSKREGMAFDSDVPSTSSGKASLRLTANGSGPNAVDFFKKLTPGYDELYLRYYAKYEANVQWHHTGVWIGGYNPASNWPDPHAGEKPNGDDRFSVSLEPIEHAAMPRMDFYNYWMQMHSWMDDPMGSTAYYGNLLIHDPDLRASGQWQCFEIHVKVNLDPSTGAGAELGLWVEDRPILQFTDSAPLGYWVKDKFCPDAAQASDCTDYRPTQPTLVPLDLQLRNTDALKLNALWPQNYITSGGAGSVWYDDMVVATVRIGCTT